VAGLIAAAALVAIVPRFTTKEQVEPPTKKSVPEPPPTPPPVMPAVLSLKGLPPGLEVSIDGKGIGTVGPAGALSFRDVQPGRRVLLLTLSGYEPVTLEKEFAAGRSVTLTDADVPLTRSPGGVQVIADAGTTITFSQAGRAIQRVTGNAKVPLAEGNYDVVATGPAGIDATRKWKVNAGETRTLDVRTFVVTGMEQFDLSSWTHSADWYTRTGGGFVLYKPTVNSGTISFTVRRTPDVRLLSGNSRLRWVVGYVNDRTYVLMELERGFLTRSDVTDGIPQATRFPHTIQDNREFLHLSVQITGNRLFQQFSLDGRSWRPLDDWSRTAPKPERGRRTLLEGRFGLVVPEKEQIFVSNFRYQPSGTTGAASK